jgi:predicted nucleic acid-binding protein
LYGFFVADDAHHENARRTMASPETIIVPNEVLSETTWLLQRRFGYDAARAAGEFLWSQPHTEIQATDPEVLMAAWGEYEASPKLSLADCVVVATCRERDAKPWAYDRALLAAMRKR